MKIPIICRINPKKVKNLHPRISSKNPEKNATLAFIFDFLIKNSKVYLGPRRAIIPIRKLTLAIIRKLLSKNNIKLSPKEIRPNEISTNPIVLEFSYIIILLY